MPTNQILIKSNIDALEDGAKLLGLLQSEQYIAGYKPAFHSTIGAHFRHFLEHYRCLFDQLPSGTICYDDRQRDSLLESDIKYAKRTVSEMQAEFAALPAKMFDQTYRILDQQTALPVATSLQRELLFLQAHTMHHYAIVGAMARALGTHPEADFGIAIATRTHQSDNGVDSKPSEAPPCAQ